MDDVCDSTAAAELQLPSDERAPAEARRFLLASRCAEHHTEVLDEAELLVSELVTNGLRHAGPPLTLYVSCDGASGLRIAVSDGSDGQPAPRDAADHEEGGRGLTLVDYISDAWGIERTAEDKTIWVQLRGGR